MSEEGLVMTAGTNVVGFVRRWKQRKKACVAGKISKFHKKTLMVISCVCVYIKSLVKRYDM